VRAGRFGAYVNWGKVNATIPKSASPETITLDEAIALIAEREGRPARPKARGGAKAKRKPPVVAKAGAETPKPKPAAAKRKGAAAKTKPATAKRKTAAAKTKAAAAKVKRPAAKAKRPAKTGRKS
jgi:DNA topoisomerase-1